MNYLTTKQVIDGAMTYIKDNSDTLRTKMTSWLNSLMRDTANERRWYFLDNKTTDALTITGSAITLPVDYSYLKRIVVADTEYTKDDELTPYDARQADTSGLPFVGFTFTDTEIVFHGTSTGTAYLTYGATMPSTGYEYGNTSTMWPVEFIPLFERALIKTFYEYDVDTDRLPYGSQLDNAELYRLKKWDNRNKPLPEYNAHGYGRNSNGK